MNTWAKYVLFWGGLTTLVFAQDETDITDIIMQEPDMMLVSAQHPSESDENILALADATTVIIPEPEEPLECINCVQPAIQNCPEEANCAVCESL